MRQGTTTKVKSSSFSKFLRLSPVSRIMLFIGILLIIAIPLFLIYSQQQARQDELNHQYSILEKALSTGSQVSPEGLTKGLEGDIKIARAEFAADTTIFPSPNQSPETIDRLIALAKSYGVEITKTQVGIAKGAISIDTDVLEYPVIVFDINLRGQMPKFQNFLLALSDKFPTSELSKMAFTISQDEKLEDTANIVLNIYAGKPLESTKGEISIAGKQPVATFSYKKDINTDTFKIKGSKWRIDWKIAATDVKWAGFNIVVYRKGETLRYVDILSHIGGNTEGTDYIYAGGDDYYLKVITGNISTWEIKIYE